MGVGVGAAGVIRGKPTGCGPFFSLCPAWLPGSPAGLEVSGGFLEISGGFLESAGTVCRLAGFARWAFLVAQLLKNLPAMLETGVRSLGLEDPLEKGMVIHSNIIA